MSGMFQWPRRIACLLLLKLSPLFIWTEDLTFIYTLFQNIINLIFISHHYFYIQIEMKMILTWSFGKKTLSISGFLYYSLQRYLLLVELQLSDLQDGPLSIFVPDFFPWRTSFEQQLGLAINYECNPTTGLYLFDPLSQEVKMVLSLILLIVFELCFSAFNFKNVMSLGGNLAKLFRFEGVQTINSG